MKSVDSCRGLWRSRWAAIGAAVAITLGGGGLVAVNAAGGEDSTTVLTDPVRVLDSRDQVNVGLAGPFASRVPQKLQITGSVPTTTGTQTVVPTGATGVLLNVTAVAPQADGFVSIRPGDATGQPATSSLNVTAGQNVPNAVLVALPVGGANDGQIDITYDAYGQTGPSTDILIDVMGYTNNSTLADLQSKLSVLESTEATQQTQIDAKANSADVYTKAQVDALLAPPTGPMVLQLPASSFQPTIVDIGNGDYYYWSAERNRWAITDGPTSSTPCYFTEAELPPGAAFNLMSIDYATDGSSGGTLTLYRRGFGGNSAGTAVVVSELVLPAPFSSGPIEAETDNFNETTVISDNVYLIEVCQGWSRAFSEVQIDYTVPG